MASKSPDGPKLDRLPPHSIEAEQGVLGCILLSPECLSDCAALSLPHFYDLRHHAIFKAMQTLNKRRIPIDLITLQRELAGNEEIQAVGGLGYVSSLSDTVPSASNLPHYLDIVNEKFWLRKVIQTSSEVVGRCYNFEGDIGEFKFAINSDLAGILDLDRDESGCVEWTLDELMEFDFSHDPDCLLGFKDGKTTGYMCKGQGAWVVGPSGVGKSSLTLLQSILWSLGKPFCGIMPVRALRVLYIQSENAKFDGGKQFQGLLGKMGISTFSDDFEKAKTNLKLFTSKGKVGLEFCALMEKKIMQHRADLVVVDPLLAFAGIDVSRQDQCSQLLRKWIDPVLAHTGAALIGAHHTGKPGGREGRQQLPLSPIDAAYSGIGSSELVNWARAVSVLFPLGNGKFHYSLAKRGRESGATHPNGEPANGSIFIQQSPDNDVIFWEQIEPPQEQAGGSDKPAKRTKPERICGQNLHSFLAACPAEGESFRALSGRLCNWLASKEAADRMGGLNKTSSTLKTAVSMLVEADKLTQKDEKLFKGTNA